METETAACTREYESHGSIEVFRQSPKLYYQTYVAKTIEREKPSEAMQLGTLVHCSLFEPEKFAAKYFEFPFQKSDAGHYYARLRAAQEINPGKTPVPMDVWAKVDKIRAAVAADPEALRLCRASGNCEYSLKWSDVGTGLKMRCRLDKWISSEMTVLDLKTSSDPRPGPFARSVANFGYHRQQATYLDGVRSMLASESTLLGGDAGEVRFIFIVVGSEEPHDVELYELDRETVELARRQNAAALEGLAWCRQNNVWKSGNGVKRLSAPRWAFYET